MSSQTVILLIALEIEQNTNPYDIKRLLQVFPGVKCVNLVKNKVKKVGGGEEDEVLGM